MPIQPLVILGASNAYWEIRELVRDINASTHRYEIVEVLDDRPSAWVSALDGVPVSGPLERAREFHDDVRFVFGIGSHRTRLVRGRILERVGVAEERFETLIHPTAKVFSTASVGHGCIIHCNSVIFSFAVLERFVIVSAGSIIATNNLVGKGALIGSGVITAHLAAIGCYAHVGQGVLVGEGCEIGAGAQVGMGSLVLQAVKTGAFALGSPLRFLDRVEVSDEIQREWEQSKASFARPIN